MMMKHPLLLLELLSGAIHSAQSFLMEMAMHSMERASRIHSVVGQFGTLGMKFGLALEDAVAERQIGFADIH
jgi:hypothetical protein